MNRKLNVSAGAGGEVAVKRTQFDSHVSTCDQCIYDALCTTAESLWRDVVLTAMRAQGGAK